MKRILALISFTILTGCPAKKIVVYHAFITKYESSNILGDIKNSDVFHDLNLKPSDTDLYKGCLAYTEPLMRVYIGVCSSNSGLYIFGEYPDMGNDIETYKSDRLVTRMGGFNEYEVLVNVSMRVEKILKTKSAQYETKKDIIITRYDFWKLIGLVSR